MSAGDDESAAGWSQAPPPAAGGPTPVPSAGAERYTVGALVGRGGMGRVSVAHDGVLGRDVALKELEPGLAADARAHGRMAREAAITARLDHPNIVAVHDIGTLPDGRPFYTMRLVRGRSLARAMGEAADLPARLALLRNVLAACDAVAAAHDAGIVHRDLKPANILLGHHAETQVVDWGLAVPVASAVARWHPLPPVDEPGPGIAVGTPAYMSPEQARGEPPDRRHDVYSLGVTLHEVLVGAPPGRGTTGSVPATKLQAASPDRVVLDPAVPAELRAIVARALAPPDSRYPDAGALAEDLLAWFEGRRISAHEYTPAELLWRFLRAWRVPVGVGVVGALGVAGALTVGYRRAAAERDRAVSAEQVAAQARDEARQQLARTRVEQAVDATYDGERARAETLATQALLVEESPLARGVLAAFGRSERPRPLAIAPGPTCAWSVLDPDGGVLCQADGVLSRWRDGAVVWRRELALMGASAGAQGVQTWGASGLGPLLDLRDGRELAPPPPLREAWRATRPPASFRVGDGVWAPDAPEPCPRRLVLAVASDDLRRAAGLCGDGRLLVHELDSGRTRVVQTSASGEHEGAALAWVDEDTVVIGTLRGRLLEVDTADGSTRHEGDGGWGMARELTVSPDRTRVAVSGTLGGVSVWDLPTATWLAELPAAVGRAVRFAADGSLRIHDGELRTWALPLATRPSVLRVDGGVSDVAIAPGGGRIAVTTGAGSIVVYDAESGRTLLRRRLADAVVKTSTFLDDDHVAVSLMADPLLVELDVRDGSARALHPPRPQRRLAALTDGGLLGVDMSDGLFTWSRAGEGSLLVGGQNFSDLEPDPAGGFLVVGAEAVYRLRDGVLQPLGAVREPRGVAPTADGYVLAGRDAVVRHDAQGRERDRLAPEGIDFRDVASTADGRWIAGAGLNGRVYVWRQADGALVGELPGHRERVSTLEFSPDGRWLLSGSWDHTVRLWDMAALDAPAAAVAEAVGQSWGPRSSADGGAP